MSSYARQTIEQPDVTPAPADDHIAPAPRVSVQAFCETVETAAAVQSAGEDRRLGKAHLKIQMGGTAAAIEAYRSAPTPNVIILETESRNDILAGLDQLATVRLSYPRISATAGPCGLWPEDLGPSIKDRGYIENKPYYNFGCAYQRNMAAMVENPSDLLQPRPETPAYTIRRTEGFEKYRKGTSTSTTYPEAEKAKLSDTGK